MLFIEYALTSGGMAQHGEGVSDSIAPAIGACASDQRSKVTNPYNDDSLVGVTSFATDRDLRRCHLRGRSALRGDARHADATNV